MREEGREALYEAWSREDEGQGYRGDGEQREQGSGGQGEEGEIEEVYEAPREEGEEVVVREGVIAGGPEEVKADTQRFKK